MPSAPASAGVARDLGVRSATLGNWVTPGGVSVPILISQQPQWIVSAWRHRVATGTIMQPDAVTSRFA
jgi:hypothetical protein